MLLAEGMDFDEPTGSLPLYLQRLLEQLEKAVGQKTRLNAEPGERPISFDLLRAASRMKMYEGRLRPEYLGETKWNIFKEESDKARKDAWSDHGEQGYNPYANIRGYVKNARLPPLPWWRETPKAILVKETGNLGVKETTCGSTNTFTATGTFSQSSKRRHTTERQSDCARKLRRIDKISYEEFLAAVQRFSDTLPVGFQPAPDQVASMQPGLWDGDKRHDDEFLSLKADGFKVRYHTATSPETERRVADWVEQFPAMTAARVLHVCDAETLGWTYQPVADNNTRGMIYDLCWQKKVPPESSCAKGERIRRLALEVKAPWVLDLELLNAFVATSKIPNSKEVGKAMGKANAAGSATTTVRDNTSDLTSQLKEQPSIRFSKVENIWAQIYDYCVAQGNFFFILTTYDYWVFGVFGSDYTEAKVTDPLPYDLSEPNILECLVYWTQSARLVPGMFEIPWVNDNFRPPQDHVHVLGDAVLVNLRAAKAVVLAT